MTPMRFALLVASFVGAAASLSSSAAAFPARGPSSIMEPSQLIAQVHYRRHRHCWWRHGHRHCRGIRYGYDYAPIYLHFGRHGHHRHFGHHGHGHGFGHAFGHGGHHGHH